MTQLVKKPPAMWEPWVWSLGWEDLLEKGKATHSSTLACRIPWTVYFGLKNSMDCLMGSQRVRHDWVTITFTLGKVQIQCNTYQNTNGSFHSNRTNNFKISMKGIPGGPGVRTPCFHHWRPEFNPWLNWIMIPQAVQCGQNKIKFLWKHERSGTAKAILRKKKRGRGLMLPVFRQYYSILL